MKYRLGIAGGLLAVSAALSPQLPRPAGGVPPDLRRQGDSQIKDSALGQVLGEFRTSISDMLYVKADRYLHAGLSMGDHLHQEEDQEIQDQDPNRIPRDFRGWVGIMEKQVKPWQSPDMGHPPHQGEEVIPLFRLMTLLDGGYVQGYQAGSYWIAQLDPDAAIDFLYEGLERNPDAFELHLQLGLVYLQQSRLVESPETEKLLEQAAASFHASAEQALLRASDENEKGAYERSDGWQATGMSYAIEFRHGDREKAEARRLRYLAAFPENPALKLVPKD